VETCLTVATASVRAISRIDLRPTNSRSFFIRGLSSLTDILLQQLAPKIPIAVSPTIDAIPIP
jgi:hypothetical protein